MYAATCWSSLAAFARISHTHEHAQASLPKCLANGFFFVEIPRGSSPRGCKNQVGARFPQAQASGSLSGSLPKTWDLGRGFVAPRPFGSPFGFSLEPRQTKPESHTKPLGFGGSFLANVQMRQIVNSCFIPPLALYNFNQKKSHYLGVLRPSATDLAVAQTNVPRNHLVDETKD